MNKIKLIEELKEFGWEGFDKNINEFPLIMYDNKMIFKWNSNISGIYVWINKLNNKMYIGKGNNLYRRVYSEKRDFCNGRSANLIKLFNAVNKYGINNFDVRQLITSDKEKLFKLESLFVHYFDSKKNGYNCTYGGEGSSGHVVTKNQIDRQKQKLKEYWTDERKKEHTEKMRDWANDPIRKSHLISVGGEWVKNSQLIKDHKIACRKSLTAARIKKQRTALIKHYKLNNGKQLRYKEIILISPNNERIVINKVSSFCRDNNIGKMGFYRFLRTATPNKVFRGWKFISTIL
jgi:group I intron endonuclease